MRLCARSSHWVTALGMQVLAEGVETQDQLEQLRSEGCGEAQGYLFSPPCQRDHQIPALIQRLDSELRAVA